MEENRRIYCVQLSPVGEVLPDVIRIRADKMCLKGNRNQYVFKRDGEVVGSVVGNIRVAPIGEVQQPL